MADIIDINVFETTETVAITVTPNLTTINVNSITGGLVTSVNSQVGDVVSSTSDNNFTNTLKTKLDGIASGAEVNVNADWNATNGDAQILNKPTIPSIAGLATTTYVDTQDALKVDKNTAITGATKTKITFDSKGLVTSGFDATTVDIADSTNKRYQTDNQQSFNDATSSIQTQLNSKQNNLGYTPIRFLVKDAVPKTVTSAVTQVISSSYLIPANTLSSNDFIRIVTAGLTRTGTGSVSFRIYINSVNSLSGAQIIAQNSTISLSVTYSQMTRNLVVSNNIIKNVLLNTPNDVQNTVVALVPITINNAVDQYILVALSSTVSTDTITQEGLEITN